MKICAITIALLYGCIIQALSYPAVQQSGYASVYTERMDDPLAVYFTPDRFGIVTDGSQDVSDALQAAI
ncbi:MAG: hypothetical protein LBL24_11770, partial [Bacteroidales bacterium]|nr:hypothetical protein [Bacteroidales bacterium]